MFKIIDNWTNPVVLLILNRNIPGIGVILTIIIILGAGIFATNIIGRKIIQIGENILIKIPLFNNIYVSVKRILEGFLSHKKETFKKPILFEYPRKNLYQIAFITKKTSSSFDEQTGEKLYNVFLPTTPNPTSGQFVMVPESEMIILDLSVEEALKLVISGGILSPEEKPVLKQIVNRS
ncbi:MAG: DUF502 domain-containing protein [Halanaerobiales bacterium]